MLAKKKASFWHDVEDDEPFSNPPPPEINSGRHIEEDSAIDERELKVRPDGFRDRGKRAITERLGEKVPSPDILADLIAEPLLLQPIMPTRGAKYVATARSRSRSNSRNRGRDFRSRSRSRGRDYSPYYNADRDRRREKEREERNRDKYGRDKNIKDSYYKDSRDKDDHDRKRPRKDSDEDSYSRRKGRY